MTRFAALGAFLLAITPFTASAQNGDLLTRMASVNPGLKTYEAAMAIHVQMTSFPNLAFDMTGNYYRREPDQSKLEITGGLPGAASQFSKLYPHIENPARWNSLYSISKEGDNGSFTTFKLVPKVEGNIDHITAQVSDKSANVLQYRWDYKNGGWAELRNTYSKINNYMLVTSQAGHVEEPQYKGDINATLSNYKINPQLPDSVFSQ